MNYQKLLNLRRPIRGGNIIHQSIILPIHPNQPIKIIYFNGLDPMDYLKLDGLLSYQNVQWISNPPCNNLRMWNCMISSYVYILMFVPLFLFFCFLQVTTPLLKFMAEFVLNKAQRLTFDSSSPNGILVFREVSKLIVTYGSRVLSLPNAADIYTCKYKGIWICLTILSRGEIPALSGSCYSCCMV